MRERGVRLHDFNSNNYLSLTRSQSLLGLTHSRYNMPAAGGSVSAAGHHHCLSVTANTLGFSPVRTPCSAVSRIFLLKHFKTRRCKI